MKERLLFLAALMLLPFLISAQTLSVKDYESGEPIANVAVYSNDKKAYGQTDINGEIEFSSFKNTDSLIFQHPAYQSARYRREKIEAQDYSIYLREKIIQMDEALIMISRWELKKEEIPHQLISIHPESIALQNPQTAADLLAQSGQVFVQKSQLGGGSPMIRGFAANSILIVVDGVRMNNAIFRSGNLQNVINLDPNVIGEAEVVFGPGSVIYGSDALGGVMDFHTRMPEFTESDKLAFNAEAMSRYSSANQEKTLHANVSLKGKRLSSLSSFTYSNFGDLRAGANRPESYPDFGKRYQYVIPAHNEDSLVRNPDVNVQAPSGYSQFNLMQKIRTKLSNKTELVYNFLYSTTSDIPRYDRLIVNNDEGLPEDAEWYYGPQDWMMHSLRLGLYQHTIWYDEAKLTTAFQTFEESRNDRGFGSDRLRTRTENVNAYTLNLDADKKLNENNQIFYGAELVYNTVASEAYRKNIASHEVTSTATRYPDGGSNYLSAAAYLNYRWNFDPRFTLNTGLRYSYIKLNTQFEDKSFYDFPYDEIEVNTAALSGSAGLVYRPNSSWQLNLLLSSGFRAPNVDDVGKVFDSEPGNVVVPNPQLSSEYSYNLEIGTSKQLEDKLKLEATVFYSQLRDAMVRRNFSFNGQDSIMYDGELSRVQALVNAGQAYVYGMSINAVYQIFSAVSLQTSVNYTSGRDQEEDAALRHATPLFGQTTLSYQKKKLKSSFIVRYNGGLGFANLAPSEQNKPHLYTEDGALAWYTLNLIGSYQFNDHLLISGGLENILDKHYWPYSSGIAAPGRNLIVSLRAKF